MFDTRSVDVGFVVEKLSFRSGSVLVFRSYILNGLQYKAIHVQSWTGAGGSRRFRLLDIKKMDTLTFRSLTIYIYIYIYICRTAALTSRRYILNIYPTNIHTEYFKHVA